MMKFFFFLYSLGGDGKIEDRKKNLNDFRSFIPKEGEIIKERLPTDTRLSLVYFFDADTKGINQRINEINAEIRSVLTELEDVLIPLMKQNNEPIFDEAERYLDKHFDSSRLFPLKINVINEIIVETRSDRKKDKIKYDKSKSLIGAVAQLQRSGKSNVVCISDTDYITKDKILADANCVEIIDFFTSLIAAPNE